MAPDKMTPLPQQPHQIDPIFKELLSMMGKRHNFTPQTEVEVNRLPRKIDAVITLSDPAERQRVEQTTSFLRLRDHNLIEFKARNDRLYLSGYQAIRGRLYFYLSQNKLKFSKVNLSLICAGKPVSLLNDEEITFSKWQTGYYLSNELLPTLLIVVPELPHVPKHYPLLLFTSSEKQFREVIRIILQDKVYHHYVEYGYHIRPDATLEEVSMLQPPELTPRLIAAWQQFLQRVPQDMLEKTPAYQTLAAELEAKMTAYYEETFQARAQQAQQEKERAQREKERAQQEKERAQQEKERTQREAVQTRQRLLLRTLSRFFGEIPVEMVTQIETTANTALLDQWIDHAFEVESLAQFEAAVQEG